MNIKEKFALYRKLYVEILSEFDIGGWEQIDDKTNSKWKHNERSGDLLFSEGDCEYSIDEARLIKEVDGLVLFYCYENGSKYYALFDSALKITNEE